MAARIGPVYFATAAGHCFVCVAVVDDELKAVSILAVSVAQ